MTKGVLFLLFRPVNMKTQLVTLVINYSSGYVYSMVSVDSYTGLHTWPLDPGVRFTYFKCLVNTRCFLKNGNVLFNDAFNTFLFTGVWRRTYGKGPLRKRERKPAAANTWTTISD